MRHPNTLNSINLDNYVTKAEFERQISIRDQETVSLKERMQLTEVQLSHRHKLLYMLFKSNLQLSMLLQFHMERINPTEGEKKTQEKD